MSESRNPHDVEGQSLGDGQAAVVASAGSEGAVSSTPAPVRMNSNMPAHKVTAATIGAAITQILVWLNNSGDGPAISPDVSAALTVIATFAVGYLTPPGEAEQVMAFTDPRRPNNTDT